MASGDHLREAVVAARATRLELGLGLDQPVHDLLVAVEDTAGVPVAVLQLGEGVAGAYIVRRDQPFIFLNGGEPVVRQRFTLAHELGHHRLGHRAVIDGVETVEGRTGGDPREDQANAFAGELLAPEQALRGWMEAHGDPAIDVAVLARIASWFGISGPAALVRLQQAEILRRPTAIRRLRTAVQRGQHRAAERSLGLSPVEDQLAQIQRGGLMPRLPARLRDNALAAYAAGLIDLGRLAQALRRDRASVEHLVAELGIVPAAAQPDW